MIEFKIKMEDIRKKKYCEICRVFLTANHYSKHMKTKKHQIYSVNKTNVESYYCDVNDPKIIFTV